MSIADVYFHDKEGLPPPDIGADTPEISLVPPLPTDDPQGSLFVPDVDLGIKLRSEHVTEARKILQNSRLALVGRISGLTALSCEVFVDTTGKRIAHPPAELEVKTYYYPVVRFLGTNAGLFKRVSEARNALTAATEPYENSSPIAVASGLEKRLKMFDAPPVAIHVLRLWVAHIVDAELPSLFDTLERRLDQGENLDVRLMRMW